MARYRGKFSKKRPLPLASWLLILLSVLSLSTGTVVAYLAASTTPVINSFQAETDADPQIQETMQDTVKSNVKVQVPDTGYSVYVRAAIVITWKDEHGNVLPQAPAEGDYSLTLGSDWKKESDDGYYYYQSPVKSGGVTTNLIDSCTVLKAAPVDGYTLSVDIITQTIQALGTTDSENIPAVQDAWKVSIP